MLYPPPLTPNGLDREIGKVAQLFLGGISRSEGVISSDARGLLANVRAIVGSLPFDLWLATATNHMRIAVNETCHVSAAPTHTLNHCGFPSVHTRRVGKPAFRLGTSESLFDRRSSWTGVPKDGVAR
jgi:hypothetical protein